MICVSDLYTLLTWRQLARHYFFEFGWIVPCRRVIAHIDTFPHRSNRVQMFDLFLELLIITRHHGERFRRPAPSSPYSPV